MNSTLAYKCSNNVDMWGFFLKLLPNILIDKCSIHQMLYRITKKNRNYYLLFGRQTCEILHLHFILPTKIVLTFKLNQITIIPLSKMSTKVLTSMEARLLEVVIIQPHFQRVPPSNRIDVVRGTPESSIVQRECHALRLLLAQVDAVPGQGLVLLLEKDRSPDGWTEGGPGRLLEGFDAAEAVLSWNKEMALLIVWG